MLLRWGRDHILLATNAEMQIFVKLLLEKKNPTSTFAGLIWFQMVFQLDEIELHNLPSYAWPNVPAEV